MLVSLPFIPTLHHSGRLHFVPFIFIRLSRFYCSNFCCIVFYLIWNHSTSSLARIFYCSISRSMQPLYLCVRSESTGVNEISQSQSQIIPFFMFSVVLSLLNLILVNRANAANASIVEKKVDSLRKKYKTVCYIRCLNSTIRFTNLWRLTLCAVIPVTLFIDQIERIFILLFLLCLLRLFFSIARRRVLIGNKLNQGVDIPIRNYVKSPQNTINYYRHCIVLLLLLVWDGFHLYLSSI